MGVLNNLASFSIQIFTNILHFQEDSSTKSVDNTKTAANGNDATLIDYNKVRKISYNLII